MGGERSATDAEPGPGFDAGRRRFLRAASAGGVVHCAGFARAGGDVGVGAAEPSDGDENAAAVHAAPDPDFTSAVVRATPELNFNKYDPTTFASGVDVLLNDPLADWNPAEGAYVPVVASDWTLGEDRATIAIDDGYAWHDGTDLTAADVATTLRLELWMELPLSEYVRGVQATDRSTVELALRDRINRNVFESVLFDLSVNTPPGAYREWVTRFEEAEGRSEMEAVRAELARWTLEEPVGSGPFSVVDVADQRIRLEPHDGHPAADAINFETYTLELVSTNQKVWQALRTDRIDAVQNVFAPGAVVDTFPDHVLETLHSTFGGFALTFNHDHHAFGRRVVRQAVAHVVDRAQVARNSGAATKRPVDLVTGMAPGLNDQWIGSRDDLLEYGGSGVDRAASLLEDAGFEKPGGTWTDPEGRPVAGSFAVPAGWSDWVTAARTAATQLEAFGMDVELRTKETSIYWGTTYPDGRFALAASFWGGGPHPYFPFRSVLREDERANYNYPATVAVPAHGDGTGTTSVNLPRTLDRLRSSAANERRLVRDLARVVNRDLPKLPVQEKRLQSFVTTDAWAVPPAGDPRMSVKTPPTWLPKVGALRAK